MSAAELPTDDVFLAPWTGVPIESADERFPHLVVAACFPELGRVGQAACIDRPCLFGRGAPKELPRVELVQQRPGQTRAMEPLEHTGLSRRQLDLEPLGEGRLRVVNRGNLELSHNGQRCDACTAEDGDTLMLGDMLVFLVQSRPRELGRSVHSPPMDFPFGEADRYGMVGESAAAWALRNELAGASTRRCTGRL